MSWSFTAVGKPAAILAKAEADMTRYKCAEPEEQIKTKVLGIIKASLLVYPDVAAVEISASGSQQPTDQPGRFMNSVSVVIKPIYGFIE